MAILLPLSWSSCRLVRFPIKGEMLCVTCKSDLPLDTPLYTWRTYLDLIAVQMQREEGSKVLAGNNIVR